MYEILDIANYYVSVEPDVTELKIQKLVYYAYSWYIVKNNKKKTQIKYKLFAESPKAWIHGPVFNSLYKAMKKNNGKVPMSNSYKELPIEITEFLDVIYESYGKYSGNKLSHIACTEEPWKKARKVNDKKPKSNVSIKDKDIYEFYTKE